MANANMNKKTLATRVFNFSALQLAPVAFSWAKLKKNKYLKIILKKVT